ncbi:TetR/AcrR family transcriptional regulator [Burkholderia thailandensis]|uniref:TetR/AcrR family transcriptional regulator n=1 Tax=Burkholderia thailandensis TaxID=57975 RepID=UPI00192D3CAF|nr:TetR/AcrR family transcriptional regulator [Burkholderia thailandensis]MBS2127065.1 TetR/AcrR family transcriptional regulator [Burkholderia thailandensis]QRA12484.1 TetR/AcrR family transcriptional regulator [Burkholderia thailandensis]
MTKRRYTLGQRAVSQEETRRRIVEATVDLHQEVGPRDTTISAIAEKAQVQRLTVYRHFPDEAALFAACTSHWFEQNPPPAPSEWDDQEGHARTLAALHLLYSYYRKTERMWTLACRDEPDVPAMHEPMEKFRNYLASVRDDLVKHLKPKRAAMEHVRLTLGHGLQFSTWQSLARQQSDLEIAELVCAWLNGALDSNASSKAGRKHP